MKECRATKEYPFHISCGGIVYKESKSGIKILLLHRFKSEKWPYDSWHLPKGTKHSDEADPQTVEREVFEETGYQVEVLNKIGSLKSNYNLDKNTKANKITHYYLCEPIKKVRNQIEEHNKIKWVELNEAIKLVSNFKIWEREEKILKLLCGERGKAKSPLEYEISKEFLPFLLAIASGLGRIWVGKKH